MSTCKVWNVTIFSFIFCAKVTNGDKTAPRLVIKRRKTRGAETPKRNPHLWFLMIESPRLTLCEGTGCVITPRSVQGRTYFGWISPFSCPKLYRIQRAWQETAEDAEIRSPIYFLGTRWNANPHISSRRYANLGLPFSSYWTLSGSIAKPLRSK